MISCLQYAVKAILSSDLSNAPALHPGGTDICGCFAGNNWMVPVVRGEIQAINLGIAMECWSEEGKQETYQYFITIATYTYRVILP